MSRLESVNDGEIGYQKFIHWDEDIDEDSGPGEKSENVEPKVVR